MEKEKKRKGRGKGEKRKGVKEEEGKKRKGKRKGSICGLVWGYVLNKWVSQRYRKGYRKFSLLHVRNFVQNNFRCGHYAQL